MFTYGFERTPVNIVRLLIADTVDEGHVFDDEEILNAVWLNAQQFQSTQYYQAPQGQNLPSQPISYLRAAATLLDCLASNKAKLANALRVLDITINTQSAAQELRTQAANYRDVDDNAGAIVIIEQVFNGWSFRDRFWATVQRQTAQ